MKKQEIWTIELLREAFERFRKENGHYPSALEVDACPYLCTSRLIQIKFGGLHRLRERLNIPIVSYASGEYRRRLWRKVDEDSLRGEQEIGEFLKDRYGELCVHEEKRYGRGRNQLDYFVYAQENFAVEIYNTYSFSGIRGNLDSKIKKYEDFPDKLFFVVTGGEFSQSEIDRMVSYRKARPLRQNMKCLTQKAFLEFCLKNIEPLDVVLKKKLKFSN